MTLLTQAEYARHCGISRAAVSQWKKAGILIMEGDKVNVELMDDYLKRYRIVAGNVVKHAGVTRLQSGNSLNKTVKQGAPLNNQPVRLTIGELNAMLEELDYTQEFDWSLEALDKRAKLAATCIGWEAVTSDRRDDGHWGGFQLRDLELIHQHGGLCEVAIYGGFGYEMSATEVIRECREHLTVLTDPIDGATIWEPSDTVLVRPDLLPLLAHPLHENDALSG